MALCLLSCNPSCAAISAACTPCCLSMASVKPTPGICQKNSQNAACRATCLLNTIGKWGTVTAATFTCRPVTTSGNRTTIGPRGSCASSLFGSSGSFMNILIFIAIIFVIYMVLEKS
jgi:hypothetical protein